MNIHDETRLEELYKLEQKAYRNEWKRPKKKLTEINRSIKLAEVQLEIKEIWFKDFACPMNAKEIERLKAELNDLYEARKQQ